MHPLTTKKLSSLEQFPEILTHGIPDRNILWMRCEMAVDKCNVNTKETETQDQNSFSEWQNQQEDTTTWTRRPPKGGQLHGCVFSKTTIQQPTEQCMDKLTLNLNHHTQRRSVTTKWQRIITWHRIRVSNTIELMSSKRHYPVTFVRR